METHSIRASFTDHTIRAYQAYCPEIAAPALKAGRFVAPFSMSRMTWIKPSFNWMMYRSGFATKPNQEVILGIDITREGFESALGLAALSTFNPHIHASQEEWRKALAEKPVRIQWDPERDWRLNIVPGVRTIQIGISGATLYRYVNEWIVHIEDVTALAHKMAEDMKRGVIPEDRPDQKEIVYPISAELSHNICRE